MQQKEWHRNMIIGAVVAAIFFGWWLRGFLYSNWHFHLFSGRSWSYVANEFESGWTLNAKSDWIFLLTLLLSIPCFLYIWYLCTKVRWRKLFKKAWKWLLAVWALLWAKKTVKNNKKKQTVLAPPPPPAAKGVVSSARPKPLGHFTPSINVPANQEAVSSDMPAPTFSKTSANVEYPAQDSGFSNGASLDPDISNIPLEDIQLPQREPVVEDVPGLFVAAGYQLIKDVKTSLQTLEFLAVGAEKIYAVLMDREAGDWLAEEEPFNGEAPLWFSEIDHRVSPVYELKQGVAELQATLSESFPDKTVQAFMIEEKGNIINAEEMMRAWKELDVIVARTDVGGTEDLPVTALAIPETAPASAAEIEGITKIIKGGNNG